MKSWGARIACAAVVLAACSEEPRTVTVQCVIDEDCPEGQVCEEGICIPRDSMACDRVENGAAILQVDPYVVDFGSVEAPVSQTLTLRNIGNCTLLIFDAQLAAKGASAFTCEGCADTDFPAELFRGRERTVTIHFTPGAVGAFDDRLVLASDDAEFPKLEVPLHARYDGVVKPKVDPNPVDFGYQAVGGQRERLVRLANFGSGIKKYVVTGVRIEQAGDDFGLKDPATAKVELDPVSVSPQAGLDLHVVYHPRAVADHTATLVIEADPASGTLQIPITGTSSTPPKVGVSPASIAFGTVAIGAAAATESVVITNSGGSALVVSPKWSQTTSPDFSVSPPVFPAIEPGEYLQVQVLVAPSVQGNLTGNLLLETNDPTAPVVTVPVSAIGVQPPDAAVLKVEMNFDNGTDGLFDSDLRKVDLSLENPWGFPCDRKHAKPTDWGDFGTPTWLALGPKEEPQRVLVVFGKDQLAQSGEYQAMVQYMEDCSWLPSGLLAGILGISVEALAGYLSSGVINVDGQDLSEVIAKSCFSHDGSNATVTLSLNNTVLDQRTVRLGKKGDYVYLKIRMVSGGGTALPTFSFE